MIPPKSTITGTMNCRSVKIALAVRINPIVDSRVGAATVFPAISLQWNRRNTGFARKTLYQPNYADLIEQADSVIDLCCGILPKLCMEYELLKPITYPSPKNFWIGENQVAIWSHNLGRYW